MTAVELLREADRHKTDRLQLERELKRLEGDVKQLQDERNELFPRIDLERREEYEKRTRASELLSHDEQTSAVDRDHLQKWSPPPVDSGTCRTPEQSPVYAVDCGTCSTTVQSPADAVNRGTSWTLEHSPANAVNNGTCRTSRQSSVDAVDCGTRRTTVQSPADAVDRGTSWTLEHSPADAVDSGTCRTTGQSPADAVNRSTCRTTGQSPTDAPALRGCCTKEWREFVLCTGAPAVPVRPRNASGGTVNQSRQEVPRRPMTVTRGEVDHPGELMATPPAKIFAYGPQGITNPQRSAVTLGRGFYPVNEPCNVRASVGNTYEYMPRATSSGLKTTTTSEEKMCGRNVPALTKLLRNGNENVFTWVNGTNFDGLHSKTNATTLFSCFTRRPKLN